MRELHKLTPEQKIGRILCARRFAEEDDINFALELARAGALGALQIKFNDRTGELINKFREAADYPLIFVNDMETGYPLSSLPGIPMMTLAACNNPEYSRLFGAALAKEAKEVGFSGCWGPIVDILTVNGPCSVARKAGDSPEAVLSVAREIFRAFDSYNFHGTAKHYPGGQDSEIDTHMAEGTSSADEDGLLGFDLLPYLSLMKEGLLPAIMSGHQVCPKIDELPASLSKKVIDIIRSRGFDGVIYTDSLAMMGILSKYGERGAMVSAFMAGNDIILPNYRTPTRKVYEMMLEAYREGQISDERLDEAVRRIAALAEYCSREPEAPYPVPENISEVFDSIARDSITAECREGVRAAIDPSVPRLFIVTTPIGFSEDVEAEISMTGWYDPRRVAEAIKLRFPTSEIAYISEFPSSGENERLLAKATEYGEAVFVSYCTTTAYLGTDCLTRRNEALINALAIPGKLAALVHFGNPLALENISGVSRILLGYTAPAAQTYAFDVLSGVIPARGTNPFPSLTKKHRKQII